MTFLKCIHSHINDFMREHLSIHTRYFIEDWIYPAYSLRNYFFHRYDIVKMPQLRRTQYHEVDTRMYYAVMELVRFFYEKSGWENFAWHDEIDEEGNITYNAPRYGMDSDSCLFPEYKGKFVIDILKEIYEWHTRGMDQLEKDIDYMYRPELKSLWSIMARDVKRVKRECQLHPSLSESKLIRECFDKYDLDWDILDRHLEGDRCSILDRKFVKALPAKIRKEIEDNMQKYLLLAIEIRRYLWT